MNVLCRTLLLSACVPIVALSVTQSSAMTLSPSSLVFASLVATASAAKVAAVKPSRSAMRKRARHHPSLSPVAGNVRDANRAATRQPTSGNYLNAVQVYPYSEGAIYHVLTAPGKVTDIVLQPGETLGAVAAGDTVRWVIGDTTSGAGKSKRTHVLVKPVTSGLSTNAVITTDRRTYHLALSSSTRVAMAALSWTYPADELIEIKVAAKKEETVRPVAAGLQIDQLNFNYVISGAKPAWRPLRAFDDGRQTFIQFPASITTGKAPPLFLVDVKGSTSLINYRVAGRYYVVDSLFDTAELRLGLKHQQIVRISRTNEARLERRPS